MTLIAHPAIRTYLRHIRNDAKRDYAERMAAQGVRMKLARLGVRRTGLPLESYTGEVSR